MSVTPVIRDAVLSDIEPMAELIGMLFEVEADFQGDARAQRAGLRLLLADRRARVLAAQVGCNVVGMCTGQLLVSTAEGGPAVLVEDVVVDPAWQGKGIGARLMRGIADWAVEKGASRIQLLADSDNDPALGFYDAIGFERTKLVCLRRRED